MGMMRQHHHRAERRACRLPGQWFWLCRVRRRTEADRLASRVRRRGDVIGTDRSGTQVAAEAVLEWLAIWGEAREGERLETVGLRQAIRAERKV